jgi:hypothetical protein
MRSHSSSCRTPSIKSARVGARMRAAARTGFGVKANDPSDQASSRKSAFSPSTEPTVAWIRLPSRRRMVPTSSGLPASRRVREMVPVRRFMWKSWRRSMSGICESFPSTS